MIVLQNGRRLLHNRETVSNLKRREEEVEADNDVEYDQVLVLVEVPTPITKSALGDVAIRSIV